MIVEYPWPPKELTPNARRRLHWTRVRKPIADYRFVCKALTASAKAKEPGDYQVVAITFCPPDRRRRDDDGMIGSFKAGRDGVADALGVDDHGFRPAYFFADPVKGGKVVVRLDLVEGEAKAFGELAATIVANLAPAFETREAAE